MQVRLCGGVSANTDGGEPLDVGPAKCQALLAALALSVGSAVPVSRLAELVWGPEPPRTAEKTLQSYVTRLRKGLGPASISRIGAAYRLDLEPAAVDVMRFQRHLDGGDVGSALQEWTGTPLAGLDLGGLGATVEGLVERWLGAVETDLEQRIDTDAAATIGALTELTSTYPFREGLWALFMTALYRVGRQADALAAYRSARRQLVEHLGVEPGPRLRELEALILDQHVRLSSAAAGAAPSEQVGAGAGSPSAGASPALPTGTVTFGFTDVEDSSRLWAEHGVEMSAAMARHDALVRAAVAPHGGYVFATGGDSFGVAFHRASDAVGWATELHTAIGAEPWPGHATLRMRIGLHTGETEERAKGYFGPAVIVAARLASLGHGGQTLLTSATAGLLDRADLVELGVFRIDGVLTQQRICQLGHAEHPPLRTQDHLRGNLPRATSRLIGRHGDLERVINSVRASQVVTLVGPGGIGKTRLALAAARRVENELGGAWLVELAGFASSDEVALAAARVLDVTEQPGRTLIESIVAALQRRHALIVLDNCEHVITGAAELVEALTAACPDVRVLATSREGLGLVAEQLIAVAPLDPAGAAVELFNTRAAEASTQFHTPASHSEVAEICRRLDGVPLAIELAAARRTTLSPTELLARLDDRLRLLTGGRRTSVERHRTLRATIQWSYDLLSPAEQLLFARLSIFPGPFPLGAAERVGARVAEGGRVGAGDLVDVPGVDDVLGGLVDRSMLIVESGPFGRNFRLLETMRQFGAEALTAAGETDLIGQRHAQWCLDEVNDIGADLAGPAEVHAVARLDELWPNLRAAVAWACATGDRALAHRLMRPVVAEIYLRSRTEIGEWAELLLSITPPDDLEVVTFGLTWAARRYMRNLDRDAFERLVEQFGEPDDPMIRFARAFVTSNMADRIEAAPLAVAQLRQRGDEHGARLFEIAGLGVTLLAAGRFEDHDALLTPFAERHRQHGPPTCLNWVLGMLGISATLQQRHDAAFDFFDEAASVTIPERTNSLKSPLDARAALRRGDQADAVHVLRVYIDEMLDNDNIYLGTFACAEFINLMIEIDRLTDAAQLLDHLGTRRSAGRSDDRALVGNAAARIAAKAGGVAPAIVPLGLDDRGVLVHMRDVLEQLAAP